MTQVEKHLSLLGLRVEDKVTKAVGVVDSISFDLYGCVQAGLNPGMDKDNKQLECRWYDVSRLTVLDETPVMSQPNYEYGQVARGEHGPADKAPRHQC